MDKIKILVCAHKECPIRNDHIYMPIHAGKACSNVDLGFQGDDTGDNISLKNPEYCEQTVLYWAWKNLKNVEYIGLNHYRRYFAYDVNENNIDNLLKNKDIILAEPQIFPYANHNTFEAITSIEDMYILIKIVQKLYPQYYNKMVSYLYDSNQYISWSMFVCNYQLFNEYAKFLFRILTESEKYIRYSGYSRNRRVLAYMGELLLPIFCYGNDLRIKFLPMRRTDIIQNNSFRTKISSLKTNVLFRLQHLRRTEEVPYWDTILNSLKQDNIII